MHAATTIMPMPETGPSVNRSWIKANAITAAIFAAIGIITFATDKLLGLGEPTTGMLFRGIGGAIAFVAMVLPLVVYAMLTGAVLGEKLPGLSRRGWIAMHAGIGVFFGIVIALATAFVPASSGEAAALPSGTILVVGALIIGFILGPLFGALIGGLQALVLRRAATGAGAWVLWSMIATTVLFLVTMSVMFAALALAARGMDLTKLGIGSHLAIQVALFAGTVLAAVIMLPAVKRLTPRG